MKIALVSLNQIWEDKDSNWKCCEEYIDNACQNNVDLLIFPEMTLTGFSLNIEKNSEDRGDSNTITRFKKKSKESNMAIIFGMLIKDGEFFYNKSFFISDNGSVIGEYAKIHTFSFAGEDALVNSGSELVVVPYKGLNIGMSICYDLRFPELFSALGGKSDLIVNIANWPNKRFDHWVALLKSRAIENQIYIVGVNRTGVDGNHLQYSESSLIHDANGRSITAQVVGDNIKIYQIDKKNQEEFRKGFLTIKDRRVELYKDIL
jgi:omega-amidase